MSIDMLGLNSIDMLVRGRNVGEIDFGVIGVLSIASISAMGFLF